MFNLLRCSRLAIAKLEVRSASKCVKSLQIRLLKKPTFDLIHQSSLRRCISTSSALCTESPDGKPAPIVVYRGPLVGQMKRLKVFSFFTSGVGIFVAPTVMQEMSKAGMGIAIMMGSVMGVFTLLTPLLIHLMVRNYVTMMEYDPETDRYTATTITLMLRTRKVTFGVDDVLVPAVPGMFTTFVVKGQPLFVDAAQFEPIEHFGRIMGYDKPVDLKLGKPPHKKT